MMWSLAKISAICKGVLHGEDREVDFFVTDSRRVHLPQRSLFIAIRGERNDGHSFIRSAIESGVKSFIIDNPKYINEDASFVIVDDSLRAFQAIAKAHRKSFNYPVIGITGSYGKTTVKDLLTRKLKTHFNIVRSPRSYNSQTGVPLSIMAMREEHELGIFEAGISQPGEMKYLAEMIDPQIGIFTCIGDAHEEGFESRRQKIEEKAYLFKNSDIIIYPRDDKEIHAVLEERYGKGETMLAHWGSSEDSFLHVIDLEKIPNGYALYYCTGGKSQKIEIPSGTESSIQNTQTLLTTLHVLGISNEEITSLLTDEGDKNDHLEFIRTSYGKGLLVDIGPIDGLSLRTAKEQLNSLTDHQGIVVILSNVDGSPIANDRRIQEIADETLGCEVIQIGASSENLSSSIPHLRTFADEEVFFENIDGLLSPDKAIILHGEWSPSFSALQSRLQEKSHQTAVYVNMSSLIHNLNLYRSIIPENTKVMAMVKAFAYGSGEAEIGRLLQYHKVDYLTVAYPDEGVTLRNSGIDLPIMVLNTSPSEYSILLEHDLEPELYSSSMLRSFLLYCQENELENYPVHIKFDTGMHRLGIKPDELNETVELLRENSSVTVKSVLSHLFSSDGDDLSLSRDQISIFKEIKKRFESAFDYPIMYHILNSSGISRLPEATFDMVRIGIGLYGHSGDEKMSTRLLPVIEWRTIISQIKEVKAGETVGYGGKLKLDQDRTIAIIPVGYADGLSRTLSNGKGHVYIAGQRCPFIGNICMDMSMVDISGVTCDEGSGVELIGEHISLNDMAAAMETIPYEVLTSIPPRIKRHYIFKG